jgi:hypothetical protein
VQHRQVVHVPERPRPQPGQRGLRGPEQPDVHPVDRDRGQHDDDRAEQEEVPDQVEVRTAGRGQAAVDDLLHGDRHDDPAGGRHEGEGEGRRQPAAELRHHPQAPAQRGQGTLLAVPGDRAHGGHLLAPAGRSGHAATSVCA